jgi:uncharacterized membrane protein YphA (DoxX/SURF4 family)
MQSSFFSKDRWPSLCLRAGLAFVFLYAAVAAYITPDNWSGYLPSFLTQHFRAVTLLDMFGAAQIALSAWLLSGIYAKWAGWAAAAFLAGIILSSPSQFLITFRDVGLLLMALALATLPEQKNS